MTETLICILYMAIIAGVLTGIYATCKVVKTKSDNKMLNDAIDAVLDATDEVSQTYVDALKDKDEFDKDAQEQALNMAIDKATELMPQKAYDYIKSHSGDAIVWITSKIESYLWRSSGKSSMIDEIIEEVETVNDCEENI